MVLTMEIGLARGCGAKFNLTCAVEFPILGLGERFRIDVREATLLIAKAPLLFPLELEDVRRYVMNRFEKNPPKAETGVQNGGFLQRR